MIKINELKALQIAREKKREALNADYAKKPIDDNYNTLMQAIESAGTLEEVEAITI